MRLLELGLGRVSPILPGLLALHQQIGDRVFPVDRLVGDLHLDGGLDDLALHRFWPGLSTFVKRVNAWLAAGKTYMPARTDPDGDLMAAPGYEHLRYQPLSSLVNANAGERVALRFANLGFREGAMTITGMSMKVVGRDATPTIGRNAQGKRVATDAASVVRTELAAVLELIASGRFTHGDSEVLRPVVDNLIHDDPFLAAGKVEFLGQPVAVVVAHDMLYAREAAAKASVAVRELPAILTIDDAMAQGSFIMPPTRRLPSSMKW